jgi:hypothetical protein
MTRLSDGKFGPSRKKLADLSDKELLDERTRRRGARTPDESPPTWKRVRQYLANLELNPGATWPEVERAYARLRERYRPDKHQGDPDRHRAAEELNAYLTRAYQALRQYFRGL